MQDVITDPYNIAYIVSDRRPSLRPLTLTNVSPSQAETLLILYFPSSTRQGSQLCFLDGYKNPVKMQAKRLNAPTLTHFTPLSFPTNLTLTSGFSKNP